MNHEPGRRPNQKPETTNHKPITRGFIYYWLPVLGLCVAIFVQSSFPSPGMLPSFKFSDKLLHFLTYGVLAVLVCRAVNSHAKWRYRWGWLFLMGTLGASLYGLSDEWHQSFVAGRSAQMTDFLADFVGSVVGSGVCLWGLVRAPSRLTN